MGMNHALDKDMESDLAKPFVRLRALSTSLGSDMLSMKNCSLFTLILFFSVQIFAQQNVELTWHNAADLGVSGRGWPTSETRTPFDRLPRKAQKPVSKEIWERSINSAGLYVTFTTDAGRIDVRWRLRHPSIFTPVLSATSVAGMDLYVREGGDWMWAAVKPPNMSRPAGSRVGTPHETETTFVQNLPKKEREFRLYLPLYNGVDRVEIGITKGAEIKAVPAPAGKPIVIYGSSIIQGYGASRPGMNVGSILGRKLNREVVNLGFSGLCKMEPALADLLAELDPALFVIDCLPNMAAEEITERTVNLVKKIRAARPNTPILMVEHPNYAHTSWDVEVRESIKAKNARFLQEFNKLQKDGVKGLHYFKGDHSFGDGEGTLDGVHPTDLGYTYYANALEPAIRPLIDSKQ